MGFLRRNLMVPMPSAESFGQLSRVLLEHYDALAAGCGSPTERARTVADMFEQERRSLMPLPSDRFEAVGWYTRRCGKYGRVEVGSWKYSAGPKPTGRHPLGQGDAARS